MTQSSSAQANSGKLAWNPARKGRTLAQRRADIEHQIRSRLAQQMALTDLSQVSARLKKLHERYEQKHGKLKQQDLAAKLKVPYRTLQSWVNGEVETDRANYDKFARFYRKGLGDKNVTTNWILFGQQQPPKFEPPVAEPEVGAQLTRADIDRLKRIEEKMDEILERLRELETAEPPQEPDEPAEPAEGDEGPEGPLPGSEDDEGDAEAHG